MILFFGVQKPCRGYEISLRIAFEADQRQDRNVSLWRKKEETCSNLPDEMGHAHNGGLA
jgi:hypothetical protein